MLELHFAPTPVHDSFYMLAPTSYTYKLIRRLQYSPSNRRHEAAHDVLGIVTAREYGSRCAHMYDL